MALRFRFSRKIAPGIRINLNNLSPSVTVGGRYGRATVSRRGITPAATLGCGFSVRGKTRPWARQDNAQADVATAAPIAVSDTAIEAEIEARIDAVCGTMSDTMSDAEIEVMRNAMRDAAYETVNEALRDNRIEERPTDDNLIEEQPAAEDPYVSYQERKVWFGAAIWTAIALTFFSGWFLWGALVFAALVPVCDVLILFSNFLTRRHLRKEGVEHLYSEPYFFSS